MKKITMLLVTLILAACNSGGCGGSSKAPEAAPPAPPPSLTSVEFCQTVLDNLCERADRCEWASKDECLAVMSMQLAPCEDWSPDMVCPPGSTYDGELAYACKGPIEALACDDDSVPTQCETSSYCIPNPE